MSKPYRINPANPIEDTIFAVRATLNGPEVSGWKIERIREIIAEFDSVMQKRKDMGVTGIQGFPRGHED